MWRISVTDGIQVAAPATVIYDLLAEQLSETNDDPQSMVKRRPLDAGPVAPGYRYESTVVHNRHLCRSEGTVTRAERPRVLEETMDHYCADASRTVKGGDRWELRGVGGGATEVSLTAWKDRSGVGGLFVKWLANRSVSKISIQRRLAYVQFEAERRVKESG